MTGMSKIKKEVEVLELSSRNVEKGEYLPDAPHLWC